MELFENVDYKQFFTDARMLYDSLEDDISKELFLSRISISTMGITNAYKAYKNIELKQNVRENHSKYNELCNFFESLDSSETIIFYGIGDFGEVMVDYFNFTIERYPNILFCDKKGETTKEFFGFPVITPEELLQNYSSNKVYITTYLYQKPVGEFLLDNGIPKKNINNDFTLDMNCIYFTIFFHIRMPHIDRRKNQYFDEVVKFSKDEVFVDAGVLNGATSFEFATRCPNYKKIYMFEPCPDAYNLTLKNIKTHNFLRAELIQVGLFSEKTTLNFKNSIEEPGASAISETGDISIDVDTLDHFFIDNASETSPPPDFYQNGYRRGRTRCTARRS